MGMSVEQEGGSGGAGKSMADLNITPLVDVVLVLLIVFMVATPFAISGVNIDLPKTRTKAMDVSQKSKEPVVVSVNKQGEFYLDKERIPPESLVSRLMRVRSQENEEQIFVRGDTAVNYGRVMEAMSAAQLAGFAKIGMLGEAALPGKK